MRVLIGYDGSEEARAAIADLARAALPPDTEATVLNVVDVVPFLVGPDEPRYASTIVRRARQEAMGMMDDARKLAQEGAAEVLRSLPGWRVQSEVVADSPFWAFVTRADAGETDLIVVGSRGLSGFRALTIGSVSSNILHHASCTVRIGRSGKQAEPGAPVRILAAFDGSGEATAALASIAKRTWPAGSEVRIVTAMHGRTLEMAASSESPEEHFASAGDDLRPRMEVSTVARYEEPKRMILEEAERWGADCIFMGARGLSRFDRVLLGSVSGAVAARASCSVEVVRTKER
jgi:nucleotide-binding universal stress UspA family protein